MRQGPALGLIGRAAFIAIALSCACTASSPEIPPTVYDAGVMTFADTVIALSVGGTVTSCASVLPTCGAPPPTGPCTPNAALGPPDGQFYTLNAGDLIELAFLCSVVIDRVGNDFQVVSTVPSGGQAVLDVSADGSSFVSLGFLDSSTQTFDLARQRLRVIQFVRISNTGPSAILVDAVQSL